MNEWMDGWMDGWINQSNTESNDAGGLVQRAAPGLDAHQFPGAHGALRRREQQRLATRRVGVALPHRKA